MLKLREKIIAFTTGFLLSSVCLFPKIVQAQIAVEPFTIETTTKRGQASGFVKFTNNGSETFRARVYTSPFTYNENGIQILESSDQDLTPFLTFSPRELEIKPGETRRVRLVARFLPSTEKGEYRTIIFTESLEAVGMGDSNTSQVGIVPRIGVTVYVRNGEDVKANLAVEKTTYDAERKQIILQVENSGDATARPRITWNLTNSQEEVAKGNNDATTVIAGGKRNIIIQYDQMEAIPPGEYKLKGELIWDVLINPTKLPFEVNVTIPN